MGLSRAEAYTRWGIIREIEPLTESAYNFFEWIEQQKPNIGEAVDTPWHVSFHGSQFPGDDPYACPRASLYRMMDIPRMPPSRQLRGEAEAGKDIEDRIVLKYYLAGYLLSDPPPPFGKHQMQFEDPKHWLTSTVDSVVIHPNESRGKVVEIKSKKAEVIDQMQKLCRGPDPKHVIQLKCQIGLAHEQGTWQVRRCYNTGRLAVKLGLSDVDQSDNNKPAKIKTTVVEVCPEHGTAKCLREVELEPVERGFLKYVSRDDPSDTWEFMYEYDPDFMAIGRKQLALWREWWLEGVLPQTNFSDKRFSHPLNWTWTKSKSCPDSPCEWCDYGDICREDHKSSVKLGKPISLADSAGIGVAEEIRQGYSIDLVRMAVERRWNGR